MTAAQDTVFLRPRWRFVLALMVTFPLSIILLSILAIVVLDLLGIDLGIRFARSTPRPEPPDMGIALWMTFMALATLYGVVCAILLTFFRITFGRMHGPQGIQLRPLIGSWQTVRFADLTSYSACSYPAWSRRRGHGSGIALYLANGSHIQINDLHLSGIDTLVRILNEQGVRFLGAETNWFYPIMKRRFKFDPK